MDFNCCDIYIDQNRLSLSICNKIREIRINTSVNAETKEIIAQRNVYMTLNSSIEIKQIEDNIALPWLELSPTLVVADIRCHRYLVSQTLDVADTSCLRCSIKLVVGHKEYRMSQTGGLADSSTLLQRSASAAVVHTEPCTSTNRSHRVLRWLRI